VFSITFSNVCFSAQFKYKSSVLYQCSLDNIQGQRSSSSAFLFSLRNKDALEPFKSLIRPDQEHLAVFLYPIGGPSFGKHGEELQITSRPKNIPCYAKFGEVFMLPPGYTYDSAETKALLGGKESFHPSEIETYYLVVN
jgi:hypothetical protein